MKLVKKESKNEQGELKALHKQKNCSLASSFFSYAFSWISKKKHAG